LSFSKHKERKGLRKITEAAFWGRVHEPAMFLHISLIEPSVGSLLPVGMPLWDQTNYTEKFRGIFSVGITKIPWDVSVLFFGAPQYFSQLCLFSSDFDVSYHFRIRRQNQ
jgi:hypothetical protein